MKYLKSEHMNEALKWMKQDTLKRMLLYLTLLLGAVSFSAKAQQPALYQGYANTIGGFRFNYHSPISENSPSLLSRAHSDYQAIEWETEKVPEDFSGDEITFIWAYGMDVTPDSRHFDVYVDGTKLFRISNPVSNEVLQWQEQAPNGATLSFKVTRIDKHKDQMGFARLTLPRSMLHPGKAVTLKVDGQKASSNVWFMTFTERLEEKFQVWQKELMARKDDQLFMVVGVDLTYLGSPVRGEIRMGQVKQTIEVLPGTNSYEIYLPHTGSYGPADLECTIGSQKVLRKTIDLKPVREWTVYLVQHTHTDIGYTRPQTEILPEHLRYIDYALDYCDQTDNYPDNAKFRWTCEASWPVREYLKSRPQHQIDRLVQRIKEGRIEITGMFFNNSEICDESSLAAQLLPVSEFNEKGIEVKTLMQNDVNGLGWALVDYADQTELRYVIMGQHGHRARVPFDRPTAFWWESPSGKRLLAYRSEHYMQGNVLGLTSSNLETFQKGLTAYLGQLQSKGYPYTQTAFQFSGYITDNSPPSLLACELVKQWNDQYAWPKIKLATASEFMRWLEENHAGDLPVYRVAWPDWWTDGSGSAMRETQAVRITQEDLSANTTLLSMAGMMGAGLSDEINKDIEDIQDAILFYTEHTFGAAESITDPYAENSMVQWAEKSSYAWDAVMKSRMLKETAMGFIQPYFQKTDVPTILVFNTLNWKRSGLVRLFIDHDILPQGKAFRLLDKNGHQIQAQAMESRSDGTYWGLWVEDIPAVGFNTYRIEMKKEDRKMAEALPPVYELSNTYYRITLDEETGSILSVFDKELGQELTDTSGPFKTGQFIYEQLDNRHQMERFTSSKMDTEYLPLEGIRTLLQHVQCTAMKEGPVWKSLFLHGSMPGCADDRGVHLEIRLYHKQKQIEFLYSMVKLPVREAEAVYVAFPFYLPESKLFFEAQGGLVQPGLNQLEGTSSDWNTIQHFAAVRNDASQIVFVSNDAPLVQFGDINTGRFYYTHQPESAHIYSWVLNNYWTTNFVASQEGELKWSYMITSDNNASNTFATRFGWASRRPFLTRVLPKGDQEHPLRQASLLHIDAPNVLLVNMMPADSGNEIVLHLRETEGAVAEIDLTNLLSDRPAKSISQVNVFGREIKKLDDSFTLHPFESVFLKVAY